MLSMDMSFVEDFIISVVISSVVGAAWLFMDPSFYALYSKSKKHNKDIKTTQRIINYLRENSNEKLVIFNIFRDHRLEIFLLNFLGIFTYLFGFLIFPSLILSIIFCLFIFSIIYMILPFYIYDKFQPRRDLCKYSKALTRNFINSFLRLFTVLLIFVLVYVIVSDMRGKTGIDILNFVSSILNFETVSGANLSNQLSLAGICFTFAVGGTVIFSIGEFYKKQIKSLQHKKSAFEDWFEGYEKSVSLNPDLLSISVSDFNNFNKWVEDLKNKMDINNPIIFIENKWLQITIGFYLLGLWCLCPFTNTHLEVVFYLIAGLSIWFFMPLYHIINYYLNDI